MRLRWVALDQDLNLECPLFDQVRALKWDSNRAWDPDPERDLDLEWERDLDLEWDQDLEHQAPFVDPALPHPQPLAQ